MIFLGFGSNLGDRINNIYKGYELVSTIGKILKKSSVYESKALKLPDDKEQQNDYLNSVISFSTDIDPMSLLKKLKEIEEKVGTRKKKKWAPRMLDIDIILFNNLVINEENLIIPHPEIMKRYLY